MIDLEREASIVADLADHMDRMRDRAIELDQQLDTTTRGYFHPIEEDQMLGLWVSYHKSRNALLEVIDSIRKIASRPAEHVISEFTVAFSAALLLVDAARFLRDTFGQQEVIRRKLNESYLHYGIPADSFDEIQLSLTSPANAIRLREATQFYDQYYDQLRDAALTSPATSRLISVMETRIDAVRVSTGRYLKVRLDERRYQLNDSVMQKGLMRALYAFQQWGSLMVSSLSTMPGHIPRLPDAIAGQLEGMIQPGDVFVTRKEGALTNYFLPGYWPHAALYAGDQQVIESLKDGVRQRSLTSPFGNDAIALIRPKLPPAVVQQALQRARTHVGKPYDFDFDFTRSDRLVCTEVVYRSYSGLSDIEFPLTRRAGRQTLSAEDLLNLALAQRYFSPVAVYCSRCAEELLTEEKATQALRETIAEQPSADSGS